MPAADFRLDARWTPQGDAHGQLLFDLSNLSNAPLAGFRLVYTTLARNIDPDKITNATLVRRRANYHEIAPPPGLTLAPGAVWSFTVAGLSHTPSHITDGASTAYLILADGTLKDVATGDLLPEGNLTEDAGALIEAGVLTVPIGLMPWPNTVALAAFGPAPSALYPNAGTDRDALRAVAEVGALAARLFPNDATYLVLTPVTGGREIVFEAVATLGAEAYELVFSATGITLRSGTDTGLFYGLVSLAQMMRAARTQPGRFGFPAAGTIADAPRYGWRGCHLDVARQVYAIDSVRRFIDILAWIKMNVLHWHLTDDEGWRLEIKSRPELTRIGACQGPNETLLPQLGTGAKGAAGFYTQDEVAALIAHAERLKVGIMPELDIPGHCNAVLASYPDLADPEEQAQSYGSVQGYSNNALNPALPATYDFLEDVLGEAAALFSFPFIHVGGDEVGDGAWLASPAARTLMDQEGLSGSAALQAHFMRRVQAILARHGKALAGWDEVSHGGGVSPSGTVLVAWQAAEVGAALAQQGYDVIMAPGEAYYLDMAQSASWREPGLSWAGIAPPRKTYEFEATEGFAPALVGRLKGLQGCIWSENLTSTARFNHMVFPRLGAIAEAGWTTQDNKSWTRFCAQAELLPTL